MGKCGEKAGGPDGDSETTQKRFGGRAAGRAAVAGIILVV
jgi:hypothetical protein